MTEREELTTKQAAKWAGVSDRYIRQLLSDGRLEGRQLNDWLWLVDARSLERWQANRRPRAR